jgi:putative SbcD/Mre11-related phosphoesterase
MAPTYCDRAVLIEDTLVLADCHLGKGESTLELPVGDTGDVIDRFDALLAEYDPATVLVAGDLLHSFSTVPLPVSEAVDALHEAAIDRDVDVVVTPGNHDAMLDSVWAGPTRAAVRVGDTVVCHGHEAPETAADRYVVGHDHPTIEIEGRRRPCYLVGEDAYEGSTVLMVPAFNRLLAGTPVNTMCANEFMSPLVTDVDAFRPIVWDEDAAEPLAFPSLGEFRELL